MKKVNFASEENTRKKILVNFVNLEIYLIHEIKSSLNLILKIILVKMNPSKMYHLKLSKRKSQNESSNFKKYQAAL